MATRSGLSTTARIATPIRVREKNSRSATATSDRDDDDDELVVA